MAKQKDPAFLFYPNDFESRTKFMNHDQVGKYMRLLITQFQFGPLTMQQIEYVCGGICDGIILDKFTKDENGLYFNERLAYECIKRKKHSEKQKANANMRWHKIGNATAMPLENENENENENVITNKKGVKKFKKPTLDELMAYMIERSPELTAIEISELSERFMNHYESNGWKIGKNSMKNWMAAARNWIKNQNKFTKTKNHEKPTDQQIKKWLDSPTIPTN